MSDFFDKRGADRLAYEVAKAIRSGRIDARSGIGDALLDYLRVGTSPRAPESVIAWIDEHEKLNTKR